MSRGGNDRASAYSLRHFRSVGRQWLRGLLIAGLAVGVAAPAMAERQDLEQLRAQVEQFLLNHYAQSGAKRVNVEDRKSTRLNSSHVAISYAAFCLQKKN